MKPNPPPPPAPPVTLQTVLDRLAGDDGLSGTRKRDLRSAVTSFAKLKGQPPAAVPLDLADIRNTLDGMVAAQAKVSRKRWHNIRSDLATAIEASGLRPMVRTANVKLEGAWPRLLAPSEKRIRNALSRFARWATLRGIAPDVVDACVIERFIAEIDAASLTRHLAKLQRSVTLAWNALVRLHQGAGLRPVALPPSRFVRTRIPWDEFAESFRIDVHEYRVWASVPDPLADGARARALAPLSLRLQQTHLHSAASAAVTAGIPLDKITSLASLTEPETFRTLMGQLWRKDGRKLSAFTHGVGVTLIAVASEWVKASPDVVATLKELRSKLGTLPIGLTEKNEALLRKFDDPRLLVDLVQLPVELWRVARRGLATSKRSFIDVQNALAIDLLLHFGLRMQNLCSLRFDKHLHFPQGRRKPALLTIRGDETKNDFSNGARDSDSARGAPSGLPQRDCPRGDREASRCGVCYL